mgnify:FL=1
MRARAYLFSFMTGIRRSEMASLTPRSFRLDATPPTVTVQAKYSKHRRKDTLPLHPRLVEQLRCWLAPLADSASLFPRLGQRKTWKMIQFDLKNAGIPYVDENGLYADFHGAGRHSHVTELFRAGAMPTEVRELARHSDLQTTMRYTHLRMVDQARALAALPAPGLDSLTEPRGEPTATSNGSFPRLGCALAAGKTTGAGKRGHLSSTNGTGFRRAQPARDSAKTCKNATNVAICQQRTRKGSSSGDETRTRDLRVMNPPL